MKYIQYSFKWRRFYKKLTSWKIWDIQKTTFDKSIVQSFLCNNTAARMALLKQNFLLRKVGQQWIFMESLRTNARTWEQECNLSEMGHQKINKNAKKLKMGH